MPKEDKVGFGGRASIPAGIYRFRALGVKLVEAKGTEKLVVPWVVTEGKYKDEEVSEWFGFAKRDVYFLQQALQELELIAVLAPGEKMEPQPSKDDIMNWLEGCECNAEVTVDDYGNKISSRWV